MRNYSIPAVLIAIVVVVGWYAVARIEGPIGSVSVSNEHRATTTGAFASSGGLQLTTLKSGWGSLGSVVITAAAAGQINIYDATTSDINLRASTMSTTSIQRVNFLVSAVVGTYVFDIIMPNGILLETTGTAPTSTVTYR